MPTHLGTKMENSIIDFSVSASVAANPHPSSRRGEKDVINKISIEYPLPRIGNISTHLSACVGTADPISYVDHVEHDP